VIPLDRAAFIKIRQEIQGRQEKEEAIRNRLAPFLSGHVASYHPVRGEADVSQLGEFFPKVLPNDEMAFGNGPSVPGTFGILEPENGFVPKSDLDVILVPCTAFKGKHRLGYGGGYYDRFLKDFQGLKIGIAFDEQEADFPVHSWDIPLDIIVTQTRVIT
jgi:5-formyltetrahydrofolate cyclo-ligase